MLFFFMGLKGVGFFLGHVDFLVADGDVFGTPLPFRWECPFFSFLGLKYFFCLVPLNTPVVDSKHFFDLGLGPSLCGIMVKCRENRV